jgi:hypothetical protein
LQEKHYNKIIETGRYFDDQSFTGTKAYTWAVSVLRSFHDLLIKTLDAWDIFASHELRYFETSSDMLQSIWAEYMADMDKNVSEMRYLQRSLVQRIETFDRMKDGV